MYRYGYLFYIPVNLIFLLIFGIHGAVKKRNRAYYFFALVFCVYLNGVIEKAFFPIFTDGARHYVTFLDFINMDVTILPQYTPYQIIGNVLLTLPVGILLPFVIDCRAGARIGYSVLFSVSIELIQLLMILSLHLIDVTVDINDIILNVAGCLFGNAVFAIFCKIYVRIQEKYDYPILKYFYQVCGNCAAHRSSLYGTAE